MPCARVAEQMASKYRSRRQRRLQIVLLSRCRRLLLWQEGGGDGGALIDDGGERSAERGCCGSEWLWRDLRGKAEV